jgi:hypothetical protein
MSNFKSGMPDFSVPFLDQSGKISEVWWRFLVTIFNRTGSVQGGNITNISNIASDESGNYPPRDRSSEIEELRSELTSLRGSTKDLQATLNELAAQLVDIRQPVMQSMGNMDVIQAIGFEPVSPQDLHRYPTKDKTGVSGSRAANVALASLLTALATEGLITDNSTV